MQDYKHQISLIKDRTVIGFMAWDYDREIWVFDLCGPIWKVTGSYFFTPPFNADEAFNEKLRTISEQIPNGDFSSFRNPKHAKEQFLNLISRAILNHKKQIEVLKEMKEHFAELD